MEQADLLSEALNLTMFGMGFVFLFLTLLVFATKLMSAIIQTLQARLNNEQKDSVTTLDQELDEETKFVIEQAIKLHRGA